ncbi:penicillin-binding transpeptidase domain-containing protein [Virgibacillus soli]|uniref:serine-type D-Ala-D-Ala carboxypeptidase n=1 Tax=Paracerasibacillus soli TaxID=480284 RepID=A0ABU5CRE7_9BACI|nr:penicillin-binding transpeptidase domain-containing protein [Virgibacillus soli]MDY0408948.1 penicillin-binding transpeptidase domain-containing protein [Virgibacillus soli]
MKRLSIFVLMLLLLFISACSSEDKETLNDRFQSYTKLWENQKFDDMYQMLTSDAKKKYPTEEYIDRYKKIYHDLNISNLKISFQKLDDDELKSIRNEGEATIPFTVKMDSIAGPISFSYKATFIEQGDDDEKEWSLQWDPGFIFPDLKDGGQIGLDTIEPTRGEILDRNRMPLALNDDVWEIGIVPEKLGDNATNNKKKIASLLNISVESIDKKLNASWVEPDHFIPLKIVPKTDDSLLNQLWSIPGVLGNGVKGRVYPSGKAAAHLVGYVGNVTSEDLEKSKGYKENDVIGKSGIEKLYEKQLKGEPGAKIYIKKENQDENDEDDEIVLADKPVKNGETIQLTIDINIQEKAFNQYDGDAGTAAVMDPKTGETLALVSSPSFDPNEMVYGITQSKWDELQNDPNKPMVNRFAATYAPGSSLKPITSAIGLKNGSIKPNEGIEINGLTWSNGKGWGDYKVRRVSSSSKPVDLTDALVRSDNIYFAMQAVKMGSKAYTSGLKDFGIGEDFNYTYPIKASSISSTGSIDNEVLLANTSYGQGEIELSSLHLASAYTIFLNKGNMIKPTLLLSEEKSQIWKKDLLSSDDISLMQQALRKVVTNGSAKKAQNAPFEISGKTGTAELKLSAGESGAENGWFVAYPTKDQDLLIAMMVEHTEDRGGSSYTVEKVTNLMKSIKKK